MADALHTNFSIPHLYTGIIVSLLVGSVLLGGIQRISEVAGRLVPLMAALYILASLVVLVINANAIPSAFGLIFTHAFSPAAATGGFAGAAVWAAIRFGVARGVFSNEAGLGGGSLRRRRPNGLADPAGAAGRSPSCHPSPLQEALFLVLFGL